MAGLPVAAGTPVALHAKPAGSMPLPPALSATLAVKAAGTPAVTVTGPLTVPAGAMTSGIVVATSLSSRRPPRPPIAAWLASNLSTASQSLVASPPSARWKYASRPLLETRIAPPLPTASAEPPAIATSLRPVRLSPFAGDVVLTQLVGRPAVRR